MTLTPAQQQAISAQGNVLLTAGAGTGKTRTLVERCIQCLTTGQNPASLRQILMVTFTEAAALEMRHRIRARLEEESERDPSNARWQEELALFETAQIGTLHSFCLELVRQHFHTLSLDPQLTVMPEEEARLVSEEVLDGILEEHYLGASPQSQAIRELLQSRGRSGDRTIRGLILKLHGFTQTLPDPERWLTEQQAAAECPTPTHWETWLHQGFDNWRERWLIVLGSGGHDHPVGASCLAALRNATSGCSRAEIAEALRAITYVGDHPPPRKKKAWITPLDSLFKDARFLYSLAHVDADADPLRQDWDWVRPRMIALLQLTRQFAQGFADAKRDAGLVDFHDLEQHALTLLWDRGAGQPTEIARHWRTRLRHVFVDEYQDINAAQDLILTALSGEGPAANRFLVGDVKQSIYRFRLANPRIFQAYAAEWLKPGSHSIPLVENFRSHERLLDFVNSVFSALMNPRIGGVVYDSRARLVFGAPEQRANLSAGSSDAPRVEWHLRRRPRNDEQEGDDGETTDDLANLEESAKEARLVGLRLRRLVQEDFQIWDEDHFRSVSWKDMAVLLRSPTAKSEVYAREFSRLGIPLLVNRPGFYKALEVCDLLNLLQILDNPQQDVPLLAVLRSPLCGLDIAELAEIRLAAKGLFWTALRRWQDLAVSGQPKAPTAGASVMETNLAPNTAGEKTDTLTTVTRFFENYSRWRRLARQGSLARCLETVLAETRYDLWLESQPRGAQRALNVKRLLGLARQFGQFQRQGLFRFLRFVEAQQDAGAEPDTPPTAEQNAVRLMSIHQSKGLEFPVVALADLGKPFNLGDLNGEIILDDFYGLCPLVAPPGTRAQYPSLPHWLARQRQLEESLGDELRLLYVAFTRARDLLLLTATVSDKKIQQCEALLAEISEASLLKARSYADWLALWYAQTVARPLTSGANGLLRWHLHDDSCLTISDAASSPSAVESTPAAPTTAPNWEVLRRKITWRYPFPADTREPAKASVSALRRRAVEADEDLARPLGHKAARWPEIATRAPAKATAVEIGSALHAFMQHVNLELTSSLTALETERERLIREGALTRQQGDLVDLRHAARFFASDIGQAILGQVGHVRRELAFTSRVALETLSDFLGGSEKTGTGWNPSLPALDAAVLKEGEKSGTTWNPSLPGVRSEKDFVVVQGAADLVVILPKEIWLLDFKTDRIKPQELPGRVEQYRPQVVLYANALSSIYERPVTRSWLYFLTLGRGISITA